MSYEYRKFTAVYCDECGQRLSNDGTRWAVNEKWANHIAEKHGWQVTRENKHYCPDHPQSLCPSCHAKASNWEECPMCFDDNLCPIAKAKAEMEVARKAVAE